MDEGNGRGAEAFANDISGWPRNKRERPPLRGFQ
jgi:hypothetical protein